MSVIAWTTTPWTLPSNLALCVHPDFTYVKVQGERNFVAVVARPNYRKFRVISNSHTSADNTTEKVYIMLEDRLEALFKKPEEYAILEKTLGSALVGKKYQPLFAYFLHLKSSQPDQGAFRIVR